MSHTALYYDAHNYDPADHGVRLTVTLLAKTGPPFDVIALLDSGAGISVFDRAYAPALGIDIPTGIEIPVQAANEEGAATPSTKGYVHDVSIEILGRGLIIPVTFVPDWPEGTPNLLGMEGFFSRWAFGFEHSLGRLYYSPRP